MAEQKLKWTPSAKESLKEIIGYYNTRNGNSNYSKKLVMTLKQTIAKLPTNNFMGKMVENSTLRVLILERHHIFYRIKPTVIEILLVWDCRQDNEKLINSEKLI